MSRALSTTVTRALRQSRWTPFEARIVLDAVDASGLSPSQFAREHDVDYQRLNVWRRRLLARPAVAPNATPSAEAPVQFVELRAPAPIPVATPRYEILLPSGEIPVAEPTSARSVQHAGTWVLLAVVASMGLYTQALTLRAERVGADALRLALDALIVALGIGERCVEGARRLATNTAPVLLRATRAPEFAPTDNKYLKFTVILDVRRPPQDGAKICPLASPAEQAPQDHANWEVDFGPWASSTPNLRWTPRRTLGLRRRRGCAGCWGASRGRARARGCT